jgi:hypothetical protein
VLESLSLKVPVLASDNGTRPPGATLYRHGDLEGLLALMRSAVQQHETMVAALPNVKVDNNSEKLADSIEEICLGARSAPAANPDIPSARA